MKIVNHISPRMALRGVSVIALLCGYAANAADGPTAAGSATDIESIIVSGGRQSDGGGLIRPLDSPKSSSIVSHDFIEKQPSAVNPLQLINLAPGVNVNDRDPTGTGRTAISMRGFQSNQIGLVLDGVPVNDSGTFNVFAQEYIDAENLDQVYVQQGAGDADSPNVGETGGNIGMLILQPAKQFGVMGVQSIGQNNFVREFVRVDSGEFLDGTRAFVSYSNTQTDLWRGSGTTQRQHVDSVISHDIGDESRVSLDAFYNTADTYSYAAVSKAQLAQYGYKYNFTGNFAPLVSGNATTAQNDNNSTALAPNTLYQRSNYYLLNANPFENLVVTAKANLKLTDSIRVDVQPYLWYGFGAGGTGSYISESNTALLGVPTDLNHSGNTKDTLLFYTPFSQQQVRPGMIDRVKWTVANNEVVAGIQLEDGQLREWKPLIAINHGTGAPYDLFPNFNTETIRRADGSLARTQDQNTDTYIIRPFVVDTLRLFDDRLWLTAALQHSEVDRRGQNYLTLAQRSAGTAVAPVFPSLDQQQYVPSFGAVYHVDERTQLFFSTIKTFRATDNAVMYQPGVNLSAIKPETTVDYEAGARYAGDLVVGAVTLFNTDYSNREQSLFDATAQTTVSKNIGNVTIRGVEMEAGTAPIDGFSLYGSGSYTLSRIDNDLLVGLPNGSQVALPTTGKQLTDTPKFLVSALAKYEVDDYFAQIQGKFTSSRFSSLVDDERTSAFFTFDAAAGYKLPNVFNDRIASSVELSVSNLFDQRYLGGINFGNNAKAYNGVAANLPTYQVGSSRFVSAKLTVRY